MESTDQLTGLSDEELAEMCRKDPDDMDILSVLLKRYMPFIRRKAAQFENAMVSAEDLSQEAMLAFVRAAEKFEPGKGQGFSAYICTCVNNRMISVIRSTRAHSDEQLSDDIETSAGDEVTPETIIMERELYCEIYALLSDRELDIFRCCLEGSSYNETAEALGISVKSVDNGVQRIRKKLRYMAK